MNRTTASVSRGSGRGTASFKLKSSSASAPAKQKGRKGMEALLARVEAVRLAQRQEGHFDCFATAQSGYCDQGDCAYHNDCLGISRQVA